jgi:hypothetical protein
MLVNLKNVGDALRVLYDRAGRAVSIPIGEERRADLPDTLIETLQAAELQEGTLLVTFPAASPSPAPRGRGGRRAKEPAQAPAADVPKATVVETTNSAAVEILAKIDTYDYHSLLAATKKAVPDNQMPQRPTKEAMMEVLRKAAAKSE